MGIQSPGPSYTPEGRHRRRQLSAWQRIPKLVKISAAVCLVLLSISLAAKDWIIQWAHDRQWFRRAPAMNTRVSAGKAFDQVVSSIQPFDLELTGTSVNPATRRVEGTVLNKSDRAYADVKVTFALPDAHLAAPEWTTVTVPAIAPQGQAPFVTEPLPDGAQQWSVIRVTGTPAKKK